MNVSLGSAQMEHLAWIHRLKTHGADTIAHDWFSGYARECIVETSPTTSFALRYIPPIDVPALVTNMLVALDVGSMDSLAQHSFDSKWPRNRGIMRDDMKRFVTLVLDTAVEIVVRETSHHRKRSASDGELRIMEQRERNEAKFMDSSNDHLCDCWLRTQSSLSTLTHPHRRYRGQALTRAAAILPVPTTVSSGSLSGTTTTSRSPFMKSKKSLRTEEEQAAVHNDGTGGESKSPAMPATSLASPTMTRRNRDSTSPRAPRSATPEIQTGEPSNGHTSPRNPRTFGERTSSWVSRSLRRLHLRA